MTLPDSQSETCPKCGKTLRQGRKGTITAWISADNECACQVRSAGESGAPTDMAFDPGRAGISGVSELAAAEQRSAFLPGTPDIGEQFEILQFIGEGGMGTVYKVRDRETRQIYAAKILKPELAGDPQAVKRFEREVDAASNFVHPNVLYIHGAFRCPDGTPFMVMNFVDGQSLSDLFEFQKTLSTRQGLRIFQQVAQALSYVHQKGIVHRDLKPSNILVYQDPSFPDSIRIVDFGIAKSNSVDNNSTLTKTGEVFGSPFYMSPEQCNGQTLDARSDIYSLGCVIYEAFSGQPPFNDENSIAVIVSHMQDAPKPLRQVGAGAKAPKDLESIVMRCLEKNPRNRYQSADLLLKDLQALGAAQPISKQVNFISPHISKELIHSVLISTICFALGVLATLLVVPRPIASSVQAAGGEPKQEPLRGIEVPLPPDETKTPSSTSDYSQHDADEVLLKTVTRNLIKKK